MMWQDAWETYFEVAGHALMGSGARAVLEVPARDAWRKAYAEAGRPTQLDPESGQRFAAIWRRHLVLKMKSVCQRATKPELFFAVRLLQPKYLEMLGWRSSETSLPNKLGAVRTVRRTATDAALLFARNPPRGYDLPHGGGVPKPEEKFGRTFLTLLLLAEVHAFCWLRNASFGLGLEASLSDDGFEPRSEGLEEFRILTASRDERDHRYYSPFTRIGEFSAGARHVLDPQEERAAGGQWKMPALFTARYEPDAADRPGYRFGAWPLEPLESFLVEELERKIVTGTLGLDPVGFAGLLGGLYSMVGERLEDAEELEAAHATSIVPFGVSEIEGDELLDRGRYYLEGAGIDPGGADLAAAREHFLYLAGSAGKGPNDPIFLQTTVGNTRYSYLLHRFGCNCALDLMHADHWLHRVMDLLASRMGCGKQASLKGERVEERIWDFFDDTPRVKRVEALQGYVIERKKGQDDDDLDCPLRVGGP